jgi:hypothetical protein
MDVDRRNKIGWGRPGIFISQRPGAPSPLMQCRRPPVGPCPDAGGHSFRRPSERARIVSDTRVRHESSSSCIYIRLCSAFKSTEYVAPTREAPTQTTALGFWSWLKIVEKVGWPDGRSSPPQCGLPRMPCFPCICETTQVGNPRICAMFCYGSPRSSTCLLLGLSFGARICEGLFYWLAVWPKHLIH